MDSPIMNYDEVVDFFQKYRAKVSRLDRLTRVEIPVLESSIEVIALSLFIAVGLKHGIITRTEPSNDSGKGVIYYSRNIATRNDAYSLDVAIEEVIGWYNNPKFRIILQSCAENAKEGIKQIIDLVKLPIQE